MRPTPDRAAKHFLEAIESLDKESRKAWDRCLTREFDLGFECGGTDFSSQTLIKNDHLKRIAALGAAIKITIYTARPSDPTPSAKAPPAPTP